MNNLEEILITADSNGSQWTCSAWDPRTGSNLMTYKGGGAANFHGISMMSNEFIVTANSTKPLIHIWPINSQEQVAGMRFVTPGVVNALAVSPDGNFLLAGIQEAIYIWEICSGRMLNLLSKHYQTVTTIKFCDDGSHFVSAGQDGCVLVWNLTLVSKNKHEPLYAFNDHALSVTDIYIGNGGMRSILCTVSTDRTCKLYDLLAGKLLLNIVFSEALTCVTMNVLETNVYVGSSTGSIYSFNIGAPPRTKEYHMTNEDYTNKFIGHNGMAVTTLSLSLDGKIICSGGNDENVYLWDICSKQLIRSIPHKGAITNSFFNLSSKNLFNSEIKYFLCTANLKRMMDTSKNKTDHIVEILVKDDYEDTTIIDEYNKADNTNNNESLDELKKLQNQVAHLQRMNKQLCIYSMNKILDKH